MKELIVENWEIAVIILPLVIYVFLSLILKIFLKKAPAQRLAIDLTSLFFVIATNVAVEFYFDYKISAYSWLFIIIIMMFVGIRRYRNENEVRYGDIVRISLRFTFIIYSLLYIIVNAVGIYTKLI